MSRYEERKTDVAVGQVFKYGIHFHRLTGIWPEDDRLTTGFCKVKRYFFVVNVIGIVVYQLTAFVDEGGIDMSDCTIEAIASFAAVVKVVPVLLSRETIAKLIHVTMTIRSFPITTAKESRVINQWQKIQDKLIKTCIGSYSAVMITFLITPMLKPHGFPFQGVTTKSTFEPPWYQIIYALHIAMGVCRLISVLSGDTLSIAFMCQLCSELELVELSMRGLKCSKKEFLRKVERHANALYYGGLICDTFSVIFLLQHLFIAVLLTFTGIVILYTDSSFIASKMALIVLIASVSMLIICYVGEVVNSASLEIANTIQCNAYEAFVGDSELLKLVNFVLFRAQKPLSLAVGKNGTINLRFFCQTMSNVSSFFMLLKTVMDWSEEF